MLLIAERYRKGVPPVSGGALDQTQWITEACDFVENERQLHMAELRGLGHFLG